MGRDWCEAFDVARETFAQASRVLGFSLENACWSSGDHVHRTDVAQPGILVTSVAVMRVLEQRGLERAQTPLTAGLSLGEYTALWWAGALEFEDAVRLVRLRGEAMQRASDLLPSGMTSLMGATNEQAQALAAVGARVGICSVANLNAPGQVIVSGELKSLDAVDAAAKDHGVRRTRRLVVAGGFHSECMRPAADELARALAHVSVETPHFDVISNVDASPARDASQVRDRLTSQLCAPVLWEASMRFALARGVREFLEPAPGKVLAGLLAKIDESASVRAAATPSDLSATSALG